MLLSSGDQSFKGGSGGLIGGYRVVTNTSLVMHVEKRRTWQERLFSWPWRPWQAMQWTWVPDTRITFDKNTIYCHPAMLDHIRAAFDEKGNPK